MAGLLIKREVMLVSLFAAPGSLNSIFRLSICGRFPLHVFGRVRSTTRKRFLMVDSPAGARARRSAG